MNMIVGALDLALAGRAPQGGLFPDKLRVLELKLFGLGQFRCRGGLIQSKREEWLGLVFGHA